MKLILPSALLMVLFGAAVFAGPARSSEYLWIEAEHSTDVGSGYYFSNEPDAKLEDKRGWSMAGPGLAAEWSQGGESEWTSVSAHALETGATLKFPLEVPVAGKYRVWVRYADYARKKEEFRVRIRQNEKNSFDQIYGAQPVVDEGDETKLMWGWAFGWGSFDGELAAGKAEMQVLADAPTEARRQVDAILVTNDLAFRPQLREKPSFHYWTPLEANRVHPGPNRPALAAPSAGFTIPAAWRTPPMLGRNFSMLFNTPNDFWTQTDVPADKRVLYPFYIGHGEKILKAFIRDWGGKKDIPIWSSKLNIPIIRLGDIPEYMQDDSPFLAWLRQTKSPFGMLLNYQKVPPNDTFGDKTEMIARNLASVKGQFVGYMSGENLDYVYDIDDAKDLYPLVAKMPGGVAGRQQMLDIIGALHKAAIRRKFSRAYGTPAGQPFPTDTSMNPWETMTSALSSDMMPQVHALAEWGERTLAHEATANDAMLSLRWAFMRGASRQFGRNWLWYQSSNFGDTATTFVPGGNYGGPFTNYYHSHYDAFSGAGLPWYRKSYYSAYMAGAAGIYLEQGFDQYFIPSPGPDTVRLSPFGRITDEFMRFAERHPDRGVPYTPITFLLDRGHAWYNYENRAGALSSPPGVNPALLGYSRHDAMIRDWFNIAYYPVPKVEGEPLQSPRLSFINSPLGQVFDVLVTSKAPGATDAVGNYRAAILAGDVVVDEAWGKTLRAFVQNGGTLVVTDDQVQGPGAGALGLPTDAPQYGVAQSVVWKPAAGAGETLASNTFRYRLSAPQGTVLATTVDGKPLAVQMGLGKGHIIWIGVPKGLGLDNRATPLLSKVMLHLRTGLMPVEVSGDIEYSINRNAAGWVVTLMNNRGNYKTQHGLGVPRREESTVVTLSTAQPVSKATEWTEEQTLPVQNEGNGRKVTLEVPAGGIRIVQLAS